LITRRSDRFCHFGKIDSRTSQMACDEKTESKTALVDALRKL
jgi:hypothetical protein